MTIYRGERVAGECKVWAGERRLLPARSLSVRKHSPAGFEWGYGGSGPAQLALAILLHHSGREIALAHYQRFKQHFVGGFAKHGWTLAGEVISAWLVKQRLTEYRQGLLESN